MRSVLFRRLAVVLLGVLVVGGLATRQATAGTALPRVGLASASQYAATAYGYDTAAHHSSATGDERDFGGTAIRTSARAVAASLGDSSLAAFDLVAADTADDAVSNLPKLGVKPNFTNPAESPGTGWEWRGTGDPGTSKGSWYSPNTGESLHPDLGHPGPIGPHYDWKAPDGTTYRVYPDGTVVPK
ncbi:polymorphic toxin type 37 domain-containing protein [Jatrophihabitans telluris]|uniref:Polymorphic toxin type 37 domain-containing protein n=1 Tax=Jatrophihabitans telluris TaxID=2038343 RepID=A0ABY4R0A7_9ACTN|nr:polymorphic toxin type 37 domain-containing protein [Jatrophihabitans telluris]UQX88701.1 polymorphic toxin type 37 domain-containing protein [Jatrophihabitans telluris]